MSSSDPRHVLGQRAEDFVHQALCAAGWQCWARNTRALHAEVDWLGLPPAGDVLVAIEVKARHELDPGHPGDWLRWRQRRRLARTLEALALRCNWPGPARLDLVTVTVVAGQQVAWEHWPDVLDGSGP